MASNKHKGAAAVVKAGDEADSKLTNKSSKAHKAHAKLKLTIDGATGTDETIHHAIPRFSLSQPRAR